MPAEHRATEEEGPHPASRGGSRDGGSASERERAESAAGGDPAQDSAPPTEAEDFLDSFTVSAAQTAADEAPAEKDLWDASEDDDPFATFTVKADLKASHRGYGYDEDEDAEARAAEESHDDALPVDLERAAQPLILERDPEERRDPVRPAFDSADEHLSSSAELELDEDLSSGFSQEAAVPWVGDTSSWEGSGESAPPGSTPRAEEGSLDFRPVGATPEALPASEDDLALPPPPPPKQPGPNTMIRRAEEVPAVSHQEEQTAPEGVPGVSEEAMGDTVVGDLPDEKLVELQREIRAEQPTAQAAQERTTRRRRPEVSPVSDTVLDLPGMLEKEQQQEQTAGNPSSVGISRVASPEPRTEVAHAGVAPSQASAEPDEVLRVFEELQQESGRVLAELGELLNSELLQALDPGSSSESQMLYDVAKLTSQLSEGTARLKQEASQLGKRYHELRQTYSRIHSAVRQAKAYQMQTCPKPPKNVDGLEIRALYKPAEHVSGDFYDFVPLNEARSRWGITLGDISGHGMAAAMVVAMARKLLQVFLTQGSTPAETLRQTNRYLLADLPGGTFVTAVTGILDLEANRFELARAGHPAPVLFNRTRGQEPSLLHVGGMALGMAESEVFDRTIQEDSVELQNGDTLVLYSDGAFELSNKQQQRFGMKRFLDLVREFGSGSASYLLRKVHNNIQRFRAGTPQDDDLTVLVCKIRPDKAPTQVLQEGETTAGE